MFTTSSRFQNPNGSRQKLRAPVLFLALRDRLEIFPPVPAKSMAVRNEGAEGRAPVCHLGKLTCHGLISVNGRRPHRDGVHGVQPGFAAATSTAFQPSLLELSHLSYFPE